MTDKQLDGFVAESPPVEKHHHHGMWYHGLRTLNGFTVSDVLTEMQKALEPAAYKKIEGGSGKQLTDIKPPYLLEVLTKLYGVYGLGWWHEYGEIKTERYVTTTKNGYERIVYDAQITDFRLYLVYVDTDGNQIIPEPVRSTGGSDNDVCEYAIKGAVTNALGDAAKRLLWQIHIWKDQDAPKVVVVDDSKPWWNKVVEYGRAHPEFTGTRGEPIEMSKSEAGRRALVKLRTEMVGKDLMFNDAKNLLNAVKKYTGYGSLEDMDWWAFDKLFRVYFGPYAFGGEMIADVLWHHALDASTWQKFIKAVPLEEGFVLNEQSANIIDDAIAGMILLVSTRKSKSLSDDDIANIAEQTRARLVEMGKSNEQKA